MTIKEQIKENDSNVRESYQIAYLLPGRPDGCTRYRMHQQMKAIAQNYRKFRVFPTTTFTMDHFYFSDILMTLQPRTPNMGKRYKVWDIAKLNNMKISVDYNDDVFNIPPSNQASIEEDTREELKEMIEKADAISVSTWPMRDVVNKYNSNIAIIPNYFDLHNYKDLLVTAEDARRRWLDRDKKTIVAYVGSANHTEDQDVFFDAITQIMRERSNVEVAVFGFASEKLEREFGSRFHLVKFTGLNSYYAEMYNMGIDILCPSLIESNFNKCKSNIKWLEGSLVGASLISSPIPAFSELGEDICHCVDWDNDIQVETMGWREAIEHLIDNPDERFEMLAKSQDWIAREWDINIGYKNWVEYITKVINGESVAGIDYTPKRKDGNDEVHSKEGIPIQGRDKAAGDDNVVTAGVAGCGGCGEAWGIGGV